MPLIRTAIPLFNTLLFQKLNMEEQCRVLDCRIEKNTLTCSGWIQPTTLCDKYKIRIKYTKGVSPVCFLQSPKIPPNPHIHLNSNSSFCLNIKTDLNWHERLPLANYLLPWLAEWIIYYELYLINGGIWLGPESMAHNRILHMHNLP